MAKLNTTTILDVVNKIAVGVSSSSNLKNYFEEDFEWKPQLELQDIFAETVPNAGNPSTADLNVTNNPTIIEKLDQVEMNPIFGSNGEAYAVYTIPGDNTSLKLDNFLKPQKYGVGYALRLFQNSGGFPGSEIFLTDGAFQFDYATGVMRFNDSNRPQDEGWTSSGGPLFITIYRYIGLTGAVVGVNRFFSAFTSASNASPVDFATPGILTVTHNLGAKYVGSIMIYDNNEELIIPDKITVVDSTKLDVNLMSYSPIPATWHITVLM